MMEEFQQIQGQMDLIKKQLSQLQVTAESGAGLVKVTVNGHKQVLHIAIDPSLLQPSEQTLLQDLVAGAVNLSLRLVDEKVRELLQSKAMGLFNQLPLNGF